MAAIEAAGNLIDPARGDGVGVLPLGRCPGQEGKVDDPKVGTGLASDVGVGLAGGGVGVGLGIPPGVTPGHLDGLDAHRAGRVGEVDDVKATDAAGEGVLTAAHCEAPDAVVLLGVGGATQASDVVLRIHLAQ